MTSFPDVSRFDWLDADQAIMLDRLSVNISNDLAVVLVSSVAAA